VSKLDIILEAIKYIDDLQDQLIDRLSGSSHSDRASASTSTSTSASDDKECFKVQDEDEEDEDEDDNLFSLSDGYMSDPGLVRIKYMNHILGDLFDDFLCLKNRFPFAMMLIVFALIMVQKRTAAKATHLWNCDPQILRDLSFQHS